MILREFLIAIGFQLDQASYKDFQAKFKNTVEQFEKLSKVAAVAVTSMTAVGVAVLETASKMEGLYFAAQRAGTSVSSLMALRFGGEQAGVGADAIASAVERMSSEIRSNPGMLAFFKQLGVSFQPGQGAENFKNMIVALSELNKKSPMMARQFGEALGIDEQMLNTLFANLPDFLRGMKEQEETLKRSGINADALAKRSHEAAENWRTFLVHVETLVMLFEEHVLPFLDKVVVFLIKAVDEMVALDHATKGWSTTIGGVLATVGGILGSLKAVSWLLGLVGGGSAAGAAAGAGAAGTAAEGAGAAAGAGAAGVIAPLALAAADAALFWHDLKEGRKLYDAYGGTNSITNTLKNFEGFSKKIYNDVAGHATIGYGHRVLPGEDFSGGMTQAGAMKLLLSDTLAAQNAVLRLVKVTLNSNQLKALTDFTFNVGASGLAKSTLLKMLNSGDYAGAAEQFQRWNKAGGMVRSDLTARRLGDKEMFQRPDVTINQDVKIHVTGSDSPEETGNEIAARQKQVNADLLRDMSAKVQ